jgi:hypothetical protein
MSYSRTPSASAFVARLGLSALALAALLSPAWSEGQTAAELLSPETYAELQAGGKVIRNESGTSLSLVPAQAASAQIRAAIAAEKPSIVVETLFSLPRKRPADPQGRKAELASVYGIMRSFGSLKGIEYYSATRKVMRVLYIESYRIEDAASRAALPDPAPPSADSIPAAESILAFQKDSSLGSNVYRYSFASFPDAVLVEATNLTNMVYGFVPMVAPGGFKSRLLVVPAEDAILFYSVIDANPPGIIKAKLGVSLANRAEALFRWFSAKYAAR